jgi:DNA topoisomerase-1
MPSAAELEHAHLRYVRLGGPGLGRRAGKGGWTYRRPDGSRVHDGAVLRRVRALAIPPAWTDVWICPDESGHIQAVGRDARGRLQYRYHARWRAHRDENKFGRLVAFSRVLPGLRARVTADLARPGLSHDKVVATVVRLLEATLIRVGNREYARANQHYGLTTLHDGHVAIAGAKLQFHFRGKSGKMHEVAVNDPRLARIVKQCRDIPGYELFQYLGDDGQRHAIDSSDVNDYIRAATTNPAHEIFTAKDFRTWAGTVLAAKVLGEMQACQGQGRRKKNVLLAIEQVAGRLGNTKAVCRKSYIHPSVLDAYMEGEIAHLPRRRSAAREEAAVVALLRRRLAKEKHPQRLVRLLRASIKSPRTSRSEPLRRAA